MEERSVTEKYFQHLNYWSLVGKAILPLLVGMAGWNMYLQSRPPERIITKVVHVEVPGEPKIVVQKVIEKVQVPPPSDRYRIDLAKARMMRIFELTRTEKSAAGNDDWSTEIEYENALSTTDEGVKHEAIRELELKHPEAYLGK